MKLNARHGKRDRRYANASGIASLMFLLRSCVHIIIRTYIAGKVPDMLAN